MDVVGARELDATPERVGISPPLYERRGHGEPDKRKPSEGEQVDAGEDPQARDADRQERQVAGRERDRDIAAARARTHQRHRSRV